MTACKKKKKVEGEAREPREKSEIYHKIVNSYEKLNVNSWNDAHKKFHNVLTPDEVKKFEDKKCRNMTVGMYDKLMTVFSEEERAECLRMYREDREGPVKISRKLHVPYLMLSRWLQAVNKVEPEKGPQGAKYQFEEIQALALSELKRRVKGLSRMGLEDVNAILKACRENLTALAALDAQETSPEIKILTKMPFEEEGDEKPETIQ